MSEPLIVKNADSYDLDTFRDNERVEGRTLIIDGAEVADTREHMDNGVSVHMCPNDSREQLEADVHGAVHGAYAYEDYIPVDMIIGWLDRQAVITERETSERHKKFCAWCEQVTDGRIAELNAEVEKQRQRANDAERGVLSDEWYVARDRYEDDVAELTAERDLWNERTRQAHDYALELVAERDKLRELQRKLIAERDQLEERNEQLGYANKLASASEARKIEYIDELEAECKRLLNVVRIQAESFRKLEQELKEAKDGIRTANGFDLSVGEGSQSKCHAV